MAASLRLLRAAGAEVVAIGNDELVAFGEKQRCMGLAKSRDAVNVIAFEIKYFHGLVVFGREEQAFTWQIKRKMIEVARKSG